MVIVMMAMIVMVMIVLMRMIVIEMTVIVMMRIMRIQRLVCCLIVINILICGKISYLQSKSLPLRSEEKNEYNI